MVVFHSFKQYRKAMDQRIKALKKSGDKSSRTIAEYQLTYAKKLAPRKSGKLIYGLQMKKLKSGKWVAWSYVPGKFKYNFWVNKNIKAIRLWGRGNARTYASTRNTGTPGYWDLATKKTRRAFGRIAVKNARKSLRVTV